MPIIWDASLVHILVGSCIFIAWLLLTYKTKGRSSKIAYPLIQGTKTSYTPSLKVRLLQKSSWLTSGAFLLALISLLSPKIHDSYVPINTNVYKAPKIVPKEGHVIFFLMDRSSSMLKKVAGSSQTRLETAKELVKHFIIDSEERSYDQIGLMTFSRVPRVLSPLTVEHKSLLSKIDSLKAVDSDWENGTSMAYALYKGSFLINAYNSYLKKLADTNKISYAVSESILILVTDGFNQPHPEDISHELRGMNLANVKDVLKDNGIKLYIVNVEPNIELTQFLSYKYALEDLAESSGGELYVVSSKAQMENVFNVIDSQTRSKRIITDRPGQSNESYFPLAPYLLMGSFFFLFARVMMEGFWRPGGV